VRVTAKKKEKEMKSRITLISAFIITLSVHAIVHADTTLPVQPAPGVKLAYKFTNGETLRYQMVTNTSVTMPGSQSSATPGMQSTIVLREQVISVSPTGDGTLKVSIESMNITMGGQTMPYSTSGFPAMTMVMAPNGTVKNMQSTTGPNGAAMDWSQMMGSGGLGQNSAIFPTTPVNVGDSWPQVISVPAVSGSGTIKAQNQLVKLNVPTGGLNAAVIKRVFSGNMSILNAATAMTGQAMTYFSPEKGHIVKEQGTMTMQSSGTGQTAGMNMVMSYDMSLIP
jgi:hypothetical protein